MHAQRPHREPAPLRGLSPHLMPQDPDRGADARMMRRLPDAVSGPSSPTWERDRAAVGLGVSGMVQRARSTQNS